MTCVLISVVNLLSEQKSYFDGLWVVIFLFHVKSVTKNYINQNPRASEEDKTRINEFVTRVRIFLGPFLSE